MKEIKMVDLKGQYEKIKPEIDSAIMNVIENTAFINGPDVIEFKKDLENYLNIKHVIPCANGTDALQIALMALDLQPGDEVITPSFTFIATVEVIALLGLKPVFAEVYEDSFNINTDLLEKYLSPKTKAIIPVHLFGQPANIEEIMDFAKEHNLYVIEDNAQALGADVYCRNRETHKAGTFGNIGTTSFFPSKNLGCFGDGGALFTNDDQLAEKIKSLANHGMKVRYYHDGIGVNSRLDTLQAAILKIKLKHLDAYIIERQKAAMLYDALLENVENVIIPKKSSGCNHIYHQYTLKLKNVDRKNLQNYLQENGIPVMVYYPVPCHLQEAYKNYGYKKGDLPVTEKLCDCVISLPMHTELTREQIEFIVSKLKEFLKK